MANGKKGRVANYWPQLAKFLIGLFAGLCATFVPRIATALSTSNPTSEIELFGADYVLLSIVFSVFLGIGVTIIKWKKICDPPEIFGAALGIPSLVAGAFNLNVSIDAVERQAGNIDELAAQVQSLSGFPTFDSDTIDIQGLQGGISTPNKTFGFHFVTPAYAQTTLQGSKKKDGFTPGRVLDLKQYYVVLGKYPTLEAAKIALPELKPYAPNAVAVGGGRGAYVLNGLQPQPLPRAFIDASQFKSALQSTGQVGLLPAR